MTPSLPSDLTCTEARAIDRAAETEYGIPGVVLMENAGRGAAQAILRVGRDELGRGPSDLCVTILCGAGNNGGDGYVAARHLANAGATVQLVSTVDPATLRGDAAWAAGVVARMGLRGGGARGGPGDGAACDDAFRTAHVLVDGILGTGARGAPRADAAALLARARRERASRADCRVVALDVPSGLDADHGGGRRGLLARGRDADLRRTQVWLSDSGRRARPGRVRGHRRAARAPRGDRGPSSVEPGERVSPLATPRGRGRGPFPLRKKRASAPLRCRSVVPGVAWNTSYLAFPP